MPASKFASLLLVILLPALTGCTSAGLAFLNTAARTGDYELTADIAYGSDPLNRLDVYRPASDTGAPMPTVVFFYGGCWGGCMTWPKQDYRFVADALTAAGYVTVLPDYRRHPQVRWPGIREDARAALAWVRENIGQYGGDADHIFLMGHSAGAHIGAMLAFDESLDPGTRSAISGFVGLAGPYDFLPLTRDYQQTLFGPPENYPESQPINRIDGDEPPLLLLHGDGDTRVGPHNTRNLASRAQELGLDVHSRVYPGLGHGALVASMARPLWSRYPVREDVVEFLGRLASAPTAAVTSAR